MVDDESVDMRLKLCKKILDGIAEFELPRGCSITACRVREINRVELGLGHQMYQMQTVAIDVGSATMFSIHWKNARTMRLCQLITTSTYKASVFFWPLLRRAMAIPGHSD